MEVHISYDSVHLKCPEQVDPETEADCWQPRAVGRGGREWLLMGLGVPSGAMKLLWN